VLYFVWYREDYYQLFNRVFYRKLEYNEIEVITNGTFLGLSNLRTLYVSKFRFLARPKTRLK